MGCHNSKTTQSYNNRNKQLSMKTPQTTINSQHTLVNNKDTSLVFKKAVNLGELKAQQANFKNNNICLEEYEIQQEDLNEITRQFCKENKTYKNIEDFNSPNNLYSLETNNTPNHVNTGITKKRKSGQILAKNSATSIKQSQKFNNLSIQQSPKAKSNKNVTELNKFLEKECGFSPKRQGSQYSRKKSNTIDIKSIKNKIQEKKVVYSDFQLKPIMVQNE